MLNCAGAISLSVALAAVRLLQKLGMMLALRLFCTLVASAICLAIPTWEQVPLRPVVPTGTINDTRVRPLVLWHGLGELYIQPNIASSSLIFNGSPPHFTPPCITHDRPPNTLTSNPPRRLSLLPRHAPICRINQRNTSEDIHTLHLHRSESRR